MWHHLSRYEATTFRKLAAIHAEDLEALKELWRLNCRPWANFSESWSWANYQREDARGGAAVDARASSARVEGPRSLDARRDG